ncbi:hypothetical protein AKO1_015570, partial [Acrasis kona]
METREALITETSAEYKKRIIKLCLRILKTSIIFAVLMVGVIWFAMYDEVHHSYSFALSKTTPLTLYLDNTKSKSYIEVTATEPVDARKYFSDPHHPLQSGGGSSMQMHIPINSILVELQAVRYGEYDEPTYYFVNNHTLSFRGELSQTSNSTKPPTTFVFKTPDEHLGDTLRLLVSGVFHDTPDDNIPFALNLDITQHSNVYGNRLIVALLVLIFVYALIVFELVDRTVATIIGAFLSISAMALMGLRPTVYEMVDWVEFHTLILLFGMMCIVAILSSTGFFEYIALKAYKLSRGSIWVLVVILCLFVAVTSGMLDNVTAMLLLTPVIIRLSKVVNISPVPILLSTVLVSNIGGCATAVGDPPVTIIVNTPEIKAAGIGFNEILFFMAPGTFLMVIASLFVLRFQFRSFWNTKPTEMSPETARLVQEVKIWLQSAYRLNELLPDEKEVKDKLMIHVQQVERELNEAHERNANQKVDLTDLEAEYKIRDKPLFIICALVLIVVITMFFLETFIHQWVHFSLDSVALIGALCVIVLADTKHFDHILEKVEWSSLLFFASLFIMMGSLSRLGLIDFVGDLIVSAIQKVPQEGRLPLAITIIVWLSSIISAIIDSIPYTTAMIPVVLSMSSQLGLPLKPLVFALAYGTGLGGNGSIIGSTANLVVSGLSEKNGYPISFASFSYYGIPIMLLTTAMANVYLLFVHCVFKLGL